MNSTELIYHQVAASIEVFQLSAEQLTPVLLDSADLLVQHLIDEGKVWVVGMGRNAANAQSFASGMLSRFEAERPGLPVVALGADGHLASAIMNDQHPNDIYARHILTLAQPKDLLITLTSQNPPPPVIKAIKAAHHKGLKVVAFTGGAGVEVTTLLQDTDFELKVASNSASQVQLTHHLLLDGLIALIESALFGQELA